MNYNDQVKCEIPITISTIGEIKSNTDDQNKTIKLSDIITIKK